MTGPGRAQVAVVGAGPAGSSVALRLARGGARVRLLDAGTFPRSKPCGDCLSPGATPLLEELGLREPLERSDAGELSGWRVRTPGGSWFDGRFGTAPPPGPWSRPSGREDARGPDPSRETDSSASSGSVPTTGYALPRRELDALLVEAATDAGADLRERIRVYGLVRREGRICGVRGRDEEGRSITVEADVVVGADGLRSAVARRLRGVRRGPRPRLAVVGRFRNVRPADGPGRGSPRAPRGEMRLGSRGCLGLAPLGDGRWNATLVVPRQEASAISRDRRRFFREHLAGYGVRRRFRAATLLGPLEVTGPFRVRPRRVTAPGLLLAGDAAGYFDPLTGQGVYRALATGRAAARAVGRLLGASGPRRRDAARRRYRLALRGVAGPGRLLQAGVDAICRRTALIDAVGRLLAVRPRLAGLFVDVTGDRLRPSALLEPARLVRALLPGAGGPETRRPGREGRAG